MKHRGKFIVLEGIDGAGTTTQSHRLTEALNHDGRRSEWTCEPSNGFMGRRLRQALSSEIDATEDEMALMFAADRLDHYHHYITPRIEAGIDVVCDRYVHSSLAYQSTHLPIGWVKSINSRAPHADITIFLDVDIETAALRRGGRSSHPERFENNQRLAQVAQAYRSVCSDEDFGAVISVDGNADQSTVFDALFKVIKQKLEESAA